MLTIRLLKRSSAVFSPTTCRFYSSLIPNDNKTDVDEATKNSRQLKKWRNENQPTNDGVLGMFNWESSNDRMFQLHSKIGVTHFKTWYGQKQQEYIKWSQRYIDERHQTLGNNLAIAHFVLHRGGKVKQSGAADFIYPDDIENIPSIFTPNWFVDEIDFSGSEICYEGLDNFENLSHLRKISFKSCKYFDDWCLEKFMVQCRNIEYLDISDCENVTARGIEGLYRSEYLKNLIVTDFDDGAAFELTCLMLEDCMPGLTVKILKPPKVDKVSVN